LKRSRGHRQSLFRNLMTELFRHERIETTTAKAKAIRPQAEKLITLAKRGQVSLLEKLAKELAGLDEAARERDLKKLANLVGLAPAKHLVQLAGEGNSDALTEEIKRLVVHPRRQAQRVITDAVVLKKLFDEIAPEFLDRPGGYTRIYKLGPRLGDGAPMVLLELAKGE